MPNGKYKALPDTSTPLLPDNNETGGLNRIYYAIRSLGLDQDTYNETASYAVGDKVIHEYTIWECTTACTGEWDETNWDVIPILVDSN